MAHSARRATAAGGKIHRVEQLIAAYRMYGVVLKRKPADRESRRKFYETETQLRQFNPAQGVTSLGQWLTAVLSMKGESDVMSVPAAVEMIRATPPEKRSAFAEEIWARLYHSGRGVHR